MKNKLKRKLARKFWICIAWLIWKWKRLKEIKPKLKWIWYGLIGGFIIVIFTLIEGLFVPYVYHELKEIRREIEALKPQEELKSIEKEPNAYRAFLIDILQTNKQPECIMIFSDCIQMQK